MEISRVGDGEVYLIAGGGKIYTDIAARFTSTEKSVPEIIGTPYSKKIVDNILTRGHYNATEFDWFIFGIEKFARVTEVQLVRKRHGSYLIKSGRQELKGKRKYSLVLPKNSKLDSLITEFTLENGQVINVSMMDYLKLGEAVYNAGMEYGIAEEDLRYLKPQATEFKAIVGMNARCLNEFFNMRCCQRAQAEIRDLAYKMLRLAKEAKPDLFTNSGPSCKSLGYCPENDAQCDLYKGKIPTKNDVKEALNQFFYNNASLDD